MRSSSELAGRLVAAGVVALVESMSGRGLASSVGLLVGDAFAGPAVTVELPAADNLGVHLALEAAGAGDVVCVGSAGRGLYGVVGELLAESARARGVVGFVVDDGVRDLAALSAPPSIAARGVSARGTVKRRVRRPVNADVSLGGTLVVAGDWMVCDADGVCAVPANRVEEVLAPAEARLERESRVREELRHGATTVEVFGLAGDVRESIG